MSHVSVLNPTQAEIASLDRHVIDTNARLGCIKQLLCDPSTFRSAVRELLEWCSDSRAFSPPFEMMLLDCLTIVHQCSPQPGFDLDIGYRLLHVVSANRERFTQQTASLLAQWTEDLGQLLLLRHQDKQQQDSQSRQHNMQQHMLQKQYTNDGGPMSWQGDGSGAPGLSVVTTVWGVTPGAQSTPNMSQHYASNQGAVRYQAPQYYRQMSAPGPGGPPHYGRTPAGYAGQAPNVTADYQPPPAALSAAAMVAAAATATATATATASMLVHEQHYGAPPGGPQQMPGQGMMQYNGQYGTAVRLPPQQSHLMQHSAPGPMPSQTQMAYRRTAPYPNPHQQYNTAPSQMYQQQVQPTAPTSHYNHGSTRPQLTLMMPTATQQQQQQQPGYSPRAPPPYGNTSPYGGPMMRSGMLPQGMHQQHYQNGYMQPALMQGQPTTPITPGSPMPPFNQHLMSQDIKPVIASTAPPSGGELQLTFPVREGIILPPFRLEHNLSVSYHVFYLKDHVYQTLMERPDLELQLKCFHHEDRQQSTNWPTSVNVSVNDRPLPIDRGEQRTYHKPLYLKQVCMPGKNTLTISVCACCCSHLFLLQLVHRPTVRSILLGLLRKRLLPGEHCINKIKRNFSSVTGGPAVDTEGVEQTSVKISLKCPITFRRIALPARGGDCRHIQCFDLESYLQLNAERGLWRCPVCNKGALLEGLEIDQYMWGIIEKLVHTDIDEINIDATAAWKPSKPIMKEEESKDMCMNNGWMKVYSPSSTNLPSVGAYEGHHNPISPYPTPPNSHNSQGSNSIAHYNGGMYDVAFNSPPDFTGPMSNRSDVSEEKEKRIGPGSVLLQRQQSGIHSPGPSSNNSASNLQHGGPPSNNPYGGPPSNAPLNGPPSNNPFGGPPSNSAQNGPPSNAPGSNQSNHHNTSVELTADIGDLVSGGSSDNLPLENLDDIDLLTYLGPTAPEEGTNENSSDAPTNEEELLSLFIDS